MAIDAKKAYALSRKYTEETVVGGGAIKGKNCTVKSITEVEGGHKVTFEWTLDDGTVKTGDMTVLNGAQGEDGIGITNITAEDNVLTIYYSDGDSVEITVPVISANALGDLRDVDIDSVSLTDGQILKWDAEEEKWVNGEGGSGSSVLTKAITAVLTVGGIDSGTEYAVGTSLEKILSDMLEPTLYPSFTNPSASLSATGSKLLEKGSTLATTFTATFNRGTINPSYGTSGYRSGEATGYQLNGGTSQSGNTWSETVTESQLTYQAKVSYAQGEQPKDSKGNNYSTPLAAGSVNSNTITYEFVDAIWANTSNIATVAKLALVSKSAKQKDFSFPAQTVANPEIFDIPASWTVTAVQVKNDLSGAWEDASAQFTKTDTTHNNAGGVSTNYKRYTFNMGYDTGARQVRVKWS